MISNTFSKNKVLILLAPGFEESVTVYCMEQMREASLQVSLVGLSNGLIRGIHGLSIQPDISLDQLEPSGQVKLVVIPGGRKCTSSLLADPRVFQLLKITIASNGIVAATSNAASILKQTGLTKKFPSTWLIPEHELELNTFTEQLIYETTNQTSLLLS